MKKTHTLPFSSQILLMPLFLKTKTRRVLLRGRLLCAPRRGLEQPEPLHPRGAEAPPSGEPVESKDLLSFFYSFKAFLGSFLERLEKSPGLIKTQRYTKYLVTFFNFGAPQRSQNTNYIVNIIIFLAPFVTPV